MGNEIQGPSSITISNRIQEIGECLAAPYPDNSRYRVFTDLLISTLYIARQLVELT